MKKTPGIELPAGGQRDEGHDRRTPTQATPTARRKHRRARPPPDLAGRTFSSGVRGFARAAIRRPDDGVCETRPCASHPSARLASRAGGDERRLPASKGPATEASPRDGVVAKLSWAFRSEPGPVRETNEDYAGAFVPTVPDDAWDRGPLLVVADGMGGHAAGEIASAVAVEAALDAWTRGTPSRAAASRAVRAAGREHRGVRRGARAGPPRDGHHDRRGHPRRAERRSSVTSGTAAPTWCDGEEGLQLTGDHSRVGEMVRMRLLSPEEAARHPARSQLTRSLGADPAVQVDLTRQPIEEGDALVLCTDGLWDLVVARRDGRRRSRRATIPRPRRHSPTRSWSWR